MFSERYQKYLNDYKYCSNCIEFRISSSLAIEKWKNNQCFQLNQINSGKIHFDREYKEIILLQYDLWTRWIIEVERFLIEQKQTPETDFITAREIEQLLILAEKTYHHYSRILMDETFGHFNIAFNDMWLKCHRQSFKLMLNQIRGLTGYTFEIAFTMLTKSLINVSQYSVMEIHELYNVIEFAQYKEIDVPFIFVSDLDQISYNIDDEFLIIHRLKLYKEVFKLKEVYLKNYTECQIAPEIFDRIESLGIKINYKLNF